MKNSFVLATLLDTNTIKNELGILFKSRQVFTVFEYNFALQGVFGSARLSEMGKENNIIQCLVQPWSGITQSRTSNYGGLWGTRRPVSTHRFRQDGEERKNGQKKSKLVYTEKPIV